jgi:hypothetical protein
MRMFFLVYLDSQSSWSVITGPAIPEDELPEGCISVPETKQTKSFEAFIKAFPEDRLLGAVSAVINAKTSGRKGHSQSEDLHRFKTLLSVVTHHEEDLTRAIAQILETAALKTVHHKRAITPESSLDDE